MVVGIALMRGLLREGRGQCPSCVVVLLASDGQKYNGRLAGQGLIHVGRELLRVNLFQEQLIQIGQDLLGRLRWQCLVPGELIMGGLENRVVDEQEPIGILSAAQLTFNPLH